MAKFYTGKDKEMFCFCGALLGKYDSKDMNTHKLACKRCRRWVWFVPQTGERLANTIPERTSSSGKRFY